MAAKITDPRSTEPDSGFTTEETGGTESEGKPDFLSASKAPALNRLRRWICASFVETS